MKALILFSGGLDSILATKLMIEQNVEAEAVHFQNPFCACSKTGECCIIAANTAHSIGVPFHNVGLEEDYLEIIKKPYHGYGKNMNPCIDCRIHQFNKAKALSEKIGASFIVTGEVLYERPMSQRRDVMEMIERVTGLQGRVLRPLSAKKLPETMPEKEGVVKREGLLGIQGRGRKVQMALAKKFGVEKYPTPSGGCLLTYAGFSDKVRDLIRHHQLTMEQVGLLKLGRHFRLSDKAKLIVGRNKAENELLLSTGTEGAVFLTAKGLPGPIAMLSLDPSGPYLEKAASIVAFYVNKVKDGNPIIVEHWIGRNGTKTPLLAKKASKNGIEALRITKS